MKNMINQREWLLLMDIKEKPSLRYVSMLSSIAVIGTISLMEHMRLTQEPFKDAETFRKCYVLWWNIMSIILMI